jgi:EmrB/QacA subfamily drug resistance transporter
VALILRPPCDEGVIRSARQAPPCAAGIRRWVLAATILGSSLAFIDGTAVNVALPTLQARLNATAADAQWVVEAYALLLAALILVGGSLGDRLGRRRIFAAGIALFAAASIGCGVSQTVGQLILLRAIQGVGGALLVPNSLAIISASFSDEERGRAIGTWSGFTAVTSAFGPVLGGWLIEHASWRWVFFMNLPLALAVLGILFARVPESREEGAARTLDGGGALLATLGLGATVYGLIEGEHAGLRDPRVLVALGVGAVALPAFLLLEARSASPMMPLTLFRSRTFRGANLLTLLLYAAVGGALFFLPFDLIQLQGYSTTAAGAAFIPLTLVMFLLSRWSGGLADRYGARRPLILGPVIAAAGLALCAVPGIGGSYWTSFFPAVTVLGIGMAISVAPLTTTVMGAVDASHAGLASGINNAVSRVGGLLAIAVLGIVVSSAFDRSLDRRLAVLPLPPETRRQLDGERVKLAGAQVPSGLETGLRRSVARAIDESFLSSFRLVMLLMAGLALASALGASWMIEEKQRDTR